MKSKSYSICVLGCKYLKKCHADKNRVIACNRFEPTEEYKKYLSVLGDMLKESGKERRESK